MKSYTTRIIAALIFSALLLGSCGSQSGRGSAKGFSIQDATAAYDSFNKHYYNTQSGVYTKSIEDRTRAAIWVQAIYWDMAMNAYKLTGEQKYRKLIDDIFEGAGKEYADFNWDNDKEWFIYDDIMWWVISLARAYEVTGEQKFLDISISGFDRVWNGNEAVGDNGSYDRENGGMRWGWIPSQRNGKMACINFPTVVGAMTLYNITGEKDYLDKAVEIYDWARERLFDAKGGRVADHKNGNNRPHWKTHLYNQATFIGAGVMLYKETGEKGYLDDAILATEYVRTGMCDQNGFLPFENGIEQGIYAAIFAQYIIRLIEDCGQEQYLDWLHENVEAAWMNRDKYRTLTYKDFSRLCPRGNIESYDASACPALMLVIAPKSLNSK